MSWSNMAALEEGDTPAAISLTYFRVALLHSKRWHCSATKNATGNNITDESGDSSLLHAPETSNSLSNGPTGTPVVAFPGAGLLGSPGPTTFIKNYCH